MNRLSELNISNKNLVIRVDMNVPIKDGTVVDNTRIIACMPTIKFALENNAKVLLITHLGRPTEGSFEEQFSLKPLVKELSRILECKVDLVDSLDSSEIFNSSSNVQILENIRFFAGEKTNSNELGQTLSSLEIYMFSTLSGLRTESSHLHILQ